MEREVRVPSTGAAGIIIETERLRMRAHRDGDLADLVALAGNWEIARWTGTIPHPYSEIDGREWIARVQENHAIGQPRRFAIALKETDRLIGGALLHCGLKSVGEIELLTSTRHGELWAPLFRISRPEL